MNLLRSELSTLGVEILITLFNKDIMFCGPQESEDVVLKPINLNMRSQT